MRKKKKEEVHTDEGFGFEGHAEEAAPAKAEEVKPVKADADVKRPELKGKQKPKHEQPGTNNISREDIGSKE
jgi:hypothetical protein